MAQGTLQKHRDETDVHSVSFNELRLATGEVLTGTPVVKVKKRTTTGWSDVTTEFGTLSPVKADTDTDVQFTLNATAAGKQLPGMYLVLVTCATDQGRTLVQPVDLAVSGRGSTT